MYIDSVSFVDNCRIVLSNCKMMSLPLKEESIINKSIEFFCDPEPCFIHRGAVMTRIIAEIDDYLFNISKEGITEIMWSDFPEKFKSTLDIQGEVFIIRFETSEKKVGQKLKEDNIKGGVHLLRKSESKKLKIFKNYQRRFLWIRRYILRKSYCILFALLF